MCAKKENKQQKNVGAHRCVRPKTPATKKRADTPVCPYGKDNKTKEQKDKTNCKGATVCAPENTGNEKRADTPVCPYGKRL